jgi:colicin import membrane protein
MACCVVSAPTWPPPPPPSADADADASVANVVRTPRPPAALPFRIEKWTLTDLGTGPLENKLPAFCVALQDCPALAVSDVLVVERQMAMASTMYALQHALLTTGAFLKRNGRPGLRTVLCHPAEKLKAYIGPVLGKPSTAKSAHARNKRLAVLHTRSLLAHHALHDEHARRWLAFFDGAKSKADDLADALLQGLACIADLSLTDAQRTTRDGAKAAAKVAAKDAKRAVMAETAAKSKATKAADREQAAAKRKATKAADRAEAAAERQATKAADRAEAAAERQATKAAKTDARVAERAALQSEASGRAKRPRIEAKIHVAKN